ncbi:MAG: AraC family transcriptional regulator [Clostridia bacterium]|nr:AraC family transcriptional regulator [Clostridia bacterium]
MSYQHEIETKKEIPHGKNMYITEHELEKSFPLHRHEYYELEYVRSGKGNVMINNTPYPFSAGTVWLCTSTDFHEIFVDEPVVTVNICFKIDWIENELINKLPFGAVINDYDEKVINRFCNEYRSNQYGNTMYLKHSLSCVLIDFARVIEKTESENLQGRFSQPVSSAIRYIQNHFNEDITLKEVATNVGLSPSYFSSRFHNEVKVSYQSYIVNLRLETAVKFLISTNYSVIDICYFSGFNNYANFTKAFKKQYGITPMQYRKNN